MTYTKLFEIGDTNLPHPTVQIGEKNDWFCKFWIEAQIYKNVVKSLSSKSLMNLSIHFNVEHTETSLAHPQCNAQVEQFLIR